MYEDVWLMVQVCRPKCSVTPSHQVRAAPCFMAAKPMPDMHSWVAIEAGVLGL